MDNLKTEPLELWNNVTSKMKKVVSEQAFATWFEPIKPVSIEKENRVQIGSDYFDVEAIEDRFDRYGTNVIKQLRIRKSR